MRFVDKRRERVYERSWSVSDSSLGLGSAQPWSVLAPRLGHFYVAVNAFEVLTSMLSLLFWAVLGSTSHG